MKAFFKNWIEFLDRDFKLSRHQVFFAVMALFIIGLGLRCGYWMMRDRPPRDERFYVQTVEKMTINDDSWKKDYDSAPLMPIIAAVVAKSGIEPETVLHVLNIVYSMLWVLVIFFLCRDVFGNDNAALLGMAIAAFNPYSVRMSVQILREPLYILIFTLSLWCALRFIKSNKYYIYPAILGGLTVLGFFTRHEGIEISIFLSLAVIVLFTQYKWQRLKICIYGLTVYMFTVGLIVGVLINYNNIFMCNANQKTIEYFRFFIGSSLK